MIVWMVAATVILLLLILLIINIMEARREFLQVRLTSLSMAAESDVVGGVGISVLVASPRSISVVVNLLDSWETVRRVLLPVLVIVVLSTVIVFAVAGKITQWLRRKGGRHD